MATSLTPEEEVLVAEHIRNMQNGCFLAIVRRLTLNQRLAFSLVDMFGLPLQEAADLIGVSDKAVKGRLYRARMNIDSFFSGHCYLLSAHNPCSCEAWIAFSANRENHKKAANTIKLVDHLDYTKSHYTFSPEVRGKIHYLYAHMPEKQPPETWFQNMIQLLQNRTPK